MDKNSHNFENDNKWSQVETLPRPLCFPAAERNVQGDIFLFGGTNSPFRGGTSYADCLIRKAAVEEWEDAVVPPMAVPRGGHCAITTLNDSIVVAGGYAGGTDYLSSVEILDRQLDRWARLPEMSVPRSGFAGVLGPDGAIYVAGGSSNGSNGHKSLERYDLREGKWSRLADMHCGRGYATGCVSTWESFLVCGGIDESKFQEGIEVYDFRAGIWDNNRLQKKASLKREQENLNALYRELHKIQSAATGLSYDHCTLLDSIQQLKEEIRIRKTYLAPKHFERACHILLRMGV